MAFSGYRCCVILVDNRDCTDPYINLAIEEYLVRNVDCNGKDYLFLYKNEPCIVLGKNQSIWKEINFEFLRKDELKICRRISGGGTVYHDPGNLNFAFISAFAEHKINNYPYFNQPIVNVLRQVGVDAEFDTRNNIIWNGKKISGSAQFTNRKNIISHGTLLLNADLKTLSACLKQNEFSIETKAVDSIRSSVNNVDGLTIEEFKQLLLTEVKHTGQHLFSQEEWHSITQLADEKFRSLEWIYGRSPHTKIIKDGTSIELEHGKVVSIKDNAASLDNLVGSYYAFNEIKKALGNEPKASHILRQVF